MELSCSIMVKLVLKSPEGRFPVGNFPLIKVSDPLLLPRLARSVRNSLDKVKLLEKPSSILHASWVIDAIINTVAIEISNFVFEAFSNGSECGLYNGLSFNRQYLKTMSPWNLIFSYNTEIGILSGINYKKDFLILEIIQNRESLIAAVEFWESF